MLWKFSRLRFLNRLLCGDLLDSCDTVPVSSPIAVAQPESLWTRC